MDVQRAPYHNSDMSGQEPQRRGFHTFVMTGDAIIRTNFNPFKPTRQLSYDNEPAKTPKVATERSISNIECSTTSSPLEQRDNNNTKPTIRVDEAESLSGSPHQCNQDKQFIPGFIRVDEEQSSSGQHRHHRPRSLNYTEDSGIDIQLSDNEADNTVQDKHKHTDHMSAKHKRVNDVPSGEHGTEFTADIDTKGHEMSQDIEKLSAKQLATKLYQLDGFEISDVCPKLSQRDTYHEEVATEFLNFFDFTDHSLVDSLRTFLSQISLSEVVEEREIVLQHFTKRYLKCNPQLYTSKTFLSEDACHTLVCALILLNDDIHKFPSEGKVKTTLRLFSDNLSNLNSGEDFPSKLLTECFHDIDSQAIISSEEDLKRRFSESLEFGVEPLPFSEQTHRSDVQVSSKRRCLNNPTANSAITSLDLEEENLCGYMLMKHCKGPGGVKMSSRKRGWRRYYTMIRDLKLLMFKSEREAPAIPAANKAINLDNLFAAVASHYKKKKHALTLTCADGSEYMLVCGDSTEMEKWIHSINLLAAVYSREEEVRYRFWRPLRKDKPPMGSYDRMGEQLEHYQTQVRDIGVLLLDSENLPHDGANKQAMRDRMQNQIKQQTQLQKFTAYVTVLKSHLEKVRRQRGFTGVDLSEKAKLRNKAPGNYGAGIEIFIPGNRLSYRQAVYGDSEGSFVVQPY